MNYNLTNIPERTARPRSFGLTVISDKGMSIAETENLLAVGRPYIDMVKLAFGTALVTPHIREKVKLYQSNNIPVFFGGLLFEAFVIRGQYNDYIKLLEEFELSFIEVSDGAISISHEEKCQYIKTLSQMGTVISEVGSKDKDKVKVTPPYQWINMMQAELDAGSAYLIAEAKESGTEGVYRNSGEVREGLVEEILTRIPGEKIIWEAPEKEQQLYFIRQLGCNANLGNIEPREVIPLETMRLGLRGDSFDLFLEHSGRKIL
jgi:phosphosulfolactate synthase